MDLIYMSDAMAYQSARSMLPSFYDTTKSWNNNSNKKSFIDKRHKNISLNVSHHGESNNQHKSHTASNKSKNGGNSSGNCKICREQQRRSLRAYIRTKSHEERDEKCILEEEEDEHSETIIESIEQDKRLPTKCSVQGILDRPSTMKML